MHSNSEKPKNSRFKPGWIIVSCAIVNLAILLVLYWAVLAPIVAMYFLPHNRIHTDLALYTQGTYQEYEDAQIFDRFVESVPLPQSAEPVSFYHVDNRREDNPIYGKRSDVFSVDMKLSESDYEKAKTELMQPDDYIGDMGNYALYLSRVDLGCKMGRRNWGVLAFDDANCVVRCIVITRLEEIKGSTPQIEIRAVLKNKTNLPFE